MKPYFVDSTGTITIDLKSPIAHNRGMKTCTKCSISKPLSDFHRNKRNRDGATELCKLCACRKAREHRDANLERYRAYDRERAQTAERKAADYIATKKKRAASRLKYKAHWTVANAIENGTLVKQPCEVCGEVEVDGHHDDYTKPLDVRWLCRTHHTAHHATKLREDALARDARR